jgi:hypothetical protein
MTSRTLTFVGFGVIVGAAAVWQVVAVVGPHRATIGQVQRWAMGSHPAICILGLARIASVRPRQRLRRTAWSSDLLKRRLPTASRLPIGKSGP